jgi:Uncharacterized conserved protein
VADVVIGLGCAFRNGGPTEEMAGRVGVACEFASLIHARYLIFSGGKTSPIVDKSESEAMKEIAGDKTQTQILIEEKSKTTIENAVYVRELLDSLNNNDHIVIVTSCFHMSRAIEIFSTIMPDRRVRAGTCFYCKPDRLGDEHRLLLENRILIQKIEWNGEDWMKKYNEIRNGN